MNKKLLLTFVLLIGTIFGYAQNTYYWVGGTTATSLGGTTWSLTPGGTAVSRNNTADVLIFDNVTVAFELGSNTIGKLIVQNGADISFERTSGAAAGSSTLTLGGSAGEGLLIDNAKLRIKGSTSTSHNFWLAFGAGITGSVKNTGQLYVTGTASNRVTLPTAGQLTFENGTSCFINSGGNPFNQNANSANKAVIFKSGSSLVYQGGLSPFGNNSAGYIIDLQTGSDFIMEANNVAGLFGSRTFANMIIKSPVTVSLTETFLSIDNLTIDAGASFLLRTSGGSGFRGNIVNNGTFGINGTPTSSQLIMLGNGTQSISGTGTFNNLGCLSVGTDAIVTLNKSLNLIGTSTSNIIGSLNVLGNVISGTNTLALRTAASTSTIGNIDIAVSANTITVADVAAFNALSPVPGLLVSGPGIPANTYVIGTSSMASPPSFTISNLATSSGNGITISGVGNAATLITSNAAGVDGSLTLPKTLASGTNYTFNAATTTPFAAGSGTSMGDVTLNSPVTVNKNFTLNGKLTLNNAKLTIPTGNIVTVSPTGTFNSFNTTSYVVTDANTATGAIGKLRVNVPAAITGIPVGSANYYTPFVITPTTPSVYDINVFEGTTKNGTPNGTALTATQKKGLVDMVWNIDRTSGTGNADITFGWRAAQEGTDFAVLADNQIGVAQYTGMFGSFTGTGNNTANTATYTASTFGPFYVGAQSTVLPVGLTSFTGKKQGSSVQLSWTTGSEERNSHFNIERSTDGVTFINIGRRDGAGTVSTEQHYNFTDFNPAAGNNYYRLVQFDTDGKSTIQNQVVAVNMGFGDVAMKVFTASNPLELNMSISTPAQQSGNLTVYGISGKKVVTKNLSLEKGNNAINVALPVLAPGVYIATYQSGDQVVREKFIR